MSFTKFHRCIVAIVAVTVYKLVAKSVFAEKPKNKNKIKYKTFPKSGPQRHTIDNVHTYKKCKCMCVRVQCTV